MESSYNIAVKSSNDDIDIDIDNIDIVMIIKEDEPVYKYRRDLNKQDIIWKQVCKEFGWLDNGSTNKLNDFKSITDTHLTSPYWKSSNIQQITGRIVRNNSHKNLPVFDIFDISSVHLEKHISQRI